MADKKPDNLVVVGLKYFMTYTLCLYYNLKYAIAVAWLFATRAHTKFWVVKDRPEPPKCLLDPELGDHKYVTVNGIKLHYVEKGDHSKPLMVFVHGFPEFWYSWRHQIREFSKDYWVVAVDNRGYNESETPKNIEGLRIDLLAADIRELVAHLGREKFILVAHDWGAVIGWHYLNKYTDTVERFIFMGAPSREIMGIILEKSLKQFRMSWYILFFIMPYFPEFCLRLFDLDIMDSIRASDTNSNTITPDDVETYKYVFGKPGAFKAPIDYYRINLLIAGGFQVTLDPCPPGLYLVGEHDKYISHESGQKLQKFYKGLDFRVIPGSNHFLQQDKPKEVNEMIRNFLSA